MQESEGLKNPKPTSIAPVIMIVLAATMIGSSLGVVIADKEVLHSIKAEAAALIGSDFSMPAAAFESVPVENAESESASEKVLETSHPTAIPESGIIPTGLFSVGTIHYAARKNSARMAFDLRDMSLVRMGKLTNPDRVYADLQDSTSAKTSSKGLKARKELEINGNLVSRIRIAHYESGTMRIVMDLERSCDYSYQQPQDGASPLVVQLESVDSGASADDARTSGDVAKGGNWVLTSHTN